MMLQALIDFMNPARPWERASRAYSATGYGYALGINFLQIAIAILAVRGVLQSLAWLADRL